jgi:hypothetical protein
MRVLVVANKTLGGTALADEIRRRAARGPCELHVLVPATRPEHGFTWTEEDARAEALERLEESLRRIRALGLEPTGEVGDSSPLLAILDTLREQPAFDEIVISTLPVGRSRWLRMDLPHRVQKAVGIPVTHVVAEVETVMH